MPNGDEHRQATIEEQLRWLQNQAARVFKLQNENELLKKEIQKLKEQLDLFEVRLKPRKKGDK